MTVYIRAQYLERPKIIEGLIPIEGFGKNVTGGSIYPTYTVTNSLCTYKDENGNNVTPPGSFDAIIGAHPSNCKIVFAEDVTEFRVGGTSRQLNGNATIDGFANNHPYGVRHAPNTGYHAVNIRGSNIHIRGINFQGYGLTIDQVHTTGQDNWVVNNGVSTPAQSDLIGINAEQREVDGVLIERCTFYRASDGAIDITNQVPTANFRVKNITIQQCFIHHCGLALLWKYGKLPSKIIENMSFHHNIIAAIGERAPQMRGPMGPIDYVNNVVMTNISHADFPADFRIPWCQDDLSEYGVRIRNSVLSSSTEQPGNIDINVIGNAFLGDRGTCQIYNDYGASDIGVYYAPTGLGADNNHFHGNTGVKLLQETAPGVLAPTVDCPASPRSIPHVIPAEFQITRHAITELKSLFPNIGCPLELDIDGATKQIVYNAMP